MKSPFCGINPYYSILIEIFMVIDSSIFCVKSPYLMEKLSIKILQISQLRWQRPRDMLQEQFLLGCVTNLVGTWWTMQLWLSIISYSL